MDGYEDNTSMICGEKLTDEDLIKWWKDETTELLNYFNLDNKEKY